MTTLLAPPPKVLQPVADAPRLVKLRFSIRYAECALAPKAIENKPILQVYLGSQFVRDRETGGVVNIHLDEDDLTKQYVGTLVGTLRREYREIPPASAIGFASYAVHRSEQGHRCYVNVGTSYALLGDVMRDAKQRGAYERNHELVMHTTVVTGNGPVHKGILAVRIAQVEVGAALAGGINAFISSNSAALITGNAVKVTETLNSYIESTFAQEQALPDTVPHTDRMRAQMDISETGAQMVQPGTFLPVAAFAIQETPRANEGFFLAAYKRTMSRRGLTLGAWHDFDTKEKARTWALVMCDAVQTFDYIGDAVELSNRMQALVGRRHVGNEEFSLIWNSLAGDCEDGERGISSVCKAFAATPMLVSAELREMQVIAREYVKLGTLSVVHGAKIGDEEGFGAHMYASFMPRHQFNAALGRTPEGRAFLERTGAALAIGAADGDAWKLELPFLFGEGTGRIDCLGYKDPIFDARRLIATQLPSMAGCKKEIPREEGAPSSFYYANLLGITDAFMEEQGVPVGAFIFCQVDAKSGAVTRGALFTDLVRGNANVALIPQPAMPAPVMTMISEAVALRPPPRPLEFDPTKPLAGPAGGRDPLWDRYVATVRGWKRAPPAQRPAAPVDCVVRPHQYSEATIQRLIAETAQVDRIYDASYEVEHVTNDIWHVRVKWWVK